MSSSAQPLFILLSLSVILITIVTLPILLYKNKRKDCESIYLFFFNGLIIYNCNLILSQITPQTDFFLKDVLYLISLSQFALVVFALSLRYRDLPVIISPYLAVISGLILMLFSALLSFYRIWQIPTNSFFSRPEFYFLAILPGILIFPFYIIANTIILQSKVFKKTSPFTLIIILAMLVLTASSFTNPLIENLPFTFTFSLDMTHLILLNLFSLPLLYLTFISLSLLPDAQELQDRESNKNKPVTSAFWARLSSFFKGKKHPLENDGQSASAEMMKIITYVFSIVSDKKGIAYEASVMDKLKQQYKDIDTSTFLSVYASLEEYITTHQPPLVAKSYTRESLELEITRFFNILKLPEAARIFFLPHSLKIIHALEIGLSDLGNFLKFHSDGKKYASILEDQRFKDISPDITLTENGLDFSRLNQRIENASQNPGMADKLIKTLKELYAALFASVENDYNQKTAFHLAENTLAQIDKTRIPPLSAELYEALPEQDKKSETVISLSKNLLETKIKERTVELEKTHEELERKISQMEIQNRTLEEAKETTSQLLEESKRLGQELIQEKNSVEEKVRIRTHELNEEKAKLSASISSLPIGLIITDLSENIVSINVQAQKILEIVTRTSTLGDLEKLFPPSFNLRETYLLSQIEKKTVEVNDLLYKNRFLSLLVTPIFNRIDRQDIFIGSLIMVSDVTEKKLLDRSKDEFFSIASHELRTPLTAIRGNASLINKLYKGKVAEPGIFEMVDDIHKSTISLIGIVNEFLDLSRLEQGKIAFKNEAFDVVELTREIIHGLLPMAREKNLELVFNTPVGDIPKVQGDMEKSREIIINLVSNAIKFTDRGKINVAFEVVDSEVNTIITDTGRGISAENQTMLFRKFQQANKNMLTRDTSKGTGLGLYISRLMAENMKGKVYLKQSVEGKGSSFIFSLPTSMN